MNTFDSSILLYINGFAGKVPLFDAVMHAFANNYMFKTIPLIAILFGFWFREESTPLLTHNKRARILASLAAAALAPFIARAIAMSLPMRPRPFQEPELHFVFPTYMDPVEAQYIDWSSFPSDNIVVLFALIAGIFVCSRRWGAAAIAIGLIAAFARVYSGLHHPTDVIAGGVLGTGMFLLIDRTPMKTWITKPSFAIMEKYPGLFYGMFFLAADQIAHMFGEILSLMNYLFHGVKIQ